MKLIYLKIIILIQAFLIFYALFLLEPEEIVKEMEINVYTDPLTGCEYLYTSAGSITPRFTGTLGIPRCASVSD